jgi:two-component system response regulator PhoP
MRILVIEDESPLRDQVSSHLIREGYAVDAAADGEEGLYFAVEHPYDLAIIDLGLPKLPGIEIIRRLRASQKTYPILILTAHGRWQEKVAGLEAGADDYMVKPFEMEELLARLRALLRRSSGWTTSTLECGPIRLNTATHEVRVHNQAIELTGHEYKLLEYLMLHSGEVISKTDLTDHIYDQDFDRDSNVIEVFVARLRRKLDPDEVLHPIETLRGRGYRFTLPRAQ